VEEAFTAADAAAATPTMPAVAVVGAGAAGELGHAYAVAFCVPPSNEEEEELALELPEGFESPLPLTLPLPPKNDPRRPPRDDCELLTPVRSSPEMKSDESPSRAAE
jgi:hypothetical protein